MTHTRVHVPDTAVHVPDTAVRYGETRTAYCDVAFVLLYVRPRYLVRRVVGTVSMSG